MNGWTNIIICIQGLKHEHQRADRDDHVTFHCENLDPICDFVPLGLSCCNWFRGGCCQKVAQFEKLSGSAYDMTGPYDWWSIMHYESTAFAKPHQRTLIRVDGLEGDPPRNRPSEGDQSRICKMYKAECDHYRNCEKEKCSCIQPCWGPRCAGSHSPWKPACCYSAGDWFSAWCADANPLVGESP